MMEQTGFYKSAFPNSAFNARMQSFSHRVKSAVSGGRKTESHMANSASCTRSTIQANTCSQLKHSLNTEKNIENYSIKTKHRQKINCFLKSKNFELVTDVMTPEKEPEGKEKKVQKQKTLAAAKKRKAS